MGSAQKSDLRIIPRVSGDGAAAVVASNGATFSGGALGLVGSGSATSLLTRITFTGNAATTGQIACTPATPIIACRNNANLANLSLVGVDAFDQIIIGDAGAALITNGAGGLYVNQSTANIIIRDSGLNTGLIITGLAAGASGLLFAASVTSVALTQSDATLAGVAAAATNITAQKNLSATGTGGPLNLSAGAGAANGSGGIVTVSGGIGASGTSPGGHAVITGGPALGTGAKGNVSIGDLPANWQSLSGGAFLRTAQVDPTAAPGSGLFLYSANGSGLMAWRDSANNRYAWGANAATATAGAGALPAAPEEFMIVTFQGNARKIPLYLT